MALGLPVPCGLGSWKARCSSEAELSLGSLEERRRDAAGRTGEKGLLLLGPEKVPHGFGLRTADPGVTADGAGNLGAGGCQLSTDYWEERGRGCLSHRLLFLFLRFGTPDRAKGGKDYVCLWVFKRLWDFNEDIKSLL